MMTFLAPMTLSWEEQILSVHTPALPGPIELLYIEAYCRADSTHRAWSETVIPYLPELLTVESDGSALEIRNDLADGVTVLHRISAQPGAVTFELTFTNPTDQPSEVHWGQPCVRVGPFTGFRHGPDIDDYLGKCFIFVDGHLERLPVQPWATEAIYTPGQVWRGPSISAEDVNPRPLSTLLPSNGLIGCFSADERLLLATAWEPCQELFQGIYRCLHADFRVGGLQPGESKTARGRLYLMENDVNALLARYQQDFGE